MEPVGVPPDGGRRLREFPGARALLVSGRDGCAVISPFDAWAIRRALAGHDLDEALARVSPTLRPLAGYLGSLPGRETRASAWQGFLRGRADRHAVIRAVDEADPG